MSSEKKPGIIKDLMGRIRNVSREEHGSAADNNARLGYTKGNIDQNQPKNVEVWDTCPVLDEQGKPLKEEQA